MIISNDKQALRKLQQDATQLFLNLAYFAMPVKFCRVNNIIELKCRDIWYLTLKCQNAGDNNLGEISIGNNPANLRALQSRPLKIRLIYSDAS